MGHKRREKHIWINQEEDEAGGYNRFRNDELRHFTFYCTSYRHSDNKRISDE